METVVLDEDGSPGQGVVGLGRGLRVDDAGLHAALLVVGFWAALMLESLGRRS